MSFLLSRFLSLFSLTFFSLSLKKKKKLSKLSKKRWKDFTFDPVNYPQHAVRALVDNLHAQGRRFVPILDPGIKLEPGYAPYDDAVAENLFLRDVTGDFYIGEVWPGACHFPDFLNPKSLDWWAKHVGEFYEKVPFDGLWIDMNEVREESFFLLLLRRKKIIKNLPFFFLFFSLLLLCSTPKPKLSIRPPTSAPATSARCPPKGSTSTTSAREQGRNPTSSSASSRRAARCSAGLWNLS